MWKRKREKVLHEATNINLWYFVLCVAASSSRQPSAWIPKAQIGFCFAPCCIISVTPSFSWAPH